MARRKVVLFIMEGPSDDTALEAILNQIYDKNTVHVEITHGDITSDYQIATRDIKTAIKDIVKSYADNMHFIKSDFEKVIHLVDMDGAYIPEQYIVENKIVKNPVYSPIEIQTGNVEAIKKRNKHKQEKLNQMQKMSVVWATIPYQVYYMSCNLDHVLYNEMNCTDEEKEDKAYQFAKKFKDNTEGFLKYISESEFSVRENYLESWEYIKEERHSLERHSNFHLCFGK